MAENTTIDLGTKSTSNNKNYLILAPAPPLSIILAPAPAPGIKIRLRNIGKQRKVDYLKVPSYESFLTLFI